MSNDIYSISLSFVIERSIFALHDLDGLKKLSIYIEKRGKKEDKLLEANYQRILSKGTYFVSPTRLKSFLPMLYFRHKNENDSGIQLADLVAYPIARYLIDPKRANPAFDLIEQKFYRKYDKRIGLKIHP